MPAQDTSQIKEHILRTFRARGPCLPAHIASEIKMSILFASAFLSELLSEKKLRISNLRVGSSPIYFIPGTESQLEKFSQHIKGKEKEAYLRLKEKRFLRDKQQEPAIRVALREIKDFAIPFEKENEIVWRYFIIPENEFESQKTRPAERSPQPEDKKKQEKKALDIFDNQKTKKVSSKKRTVKKNNDKFFNKVKEFLSSRSIEILDIESFSKNDLILRVKIKEEENLLVAYNKKRISEADIIKAHKKASELNLKYTLLSLGEPLKKTDNLIKAVKNLTGIEKIK